MRKLQVLSVLALIFAAGIHGQSPLLPVTLPERGDFYRDPATKNRVWRVTDEKLCPGGAKHYYSYVPVWNQTGTHLVVACLRGQSVVPLLMDAKSFEVVGDAGRGAPGLNAERLTWSWKDPNLLYGFNESEVWQVNPFTRKGKRIFSLRSPVLKDRTLRALRLAYISFDDRLALVELQGPVPERGDRNPWNVVGLATVEIATGKIVGQMEVVGMGYDEAVFTKDNRVWLVTREDSYRYEPDFSKRIRVANHGHHAHGLLPNGTPVAVKEASDRACPPGTVSGNPADKDYPRGGWKPTATLLNQLVESKGTPKTPPIESEIFMVGCNVPGLHNYSHFSWNHEQRDRFFLSSGSYGNAPADPTAHAILRVRLEFSGDRVASDSIDVLAHHRTRGNNYWASPRPSCNMQATRCLFASTMSVQVTNAPGSVQLYVVDVPELSR